MDMSDLLTLVLVLLGVLTLLGVAVIGNRGRIASKTEDGNAISKSSWSRVHVPKKRSIAHPPATNQWQASTLHVSKLPGMPRIPLLDVGLHPITVDASSSPGPHTYLLSVQPKLK